MINQKLISKVVTVATLFTAAAVSISAASAQTLEQIRWKSESQVRQVLGEPLSVTNPTGTHAQYTLWKYENVTVAFADGKAFHMFDKNSLRKIDLNEDRPER